MLPLSQIASVRKTVDAEWRSPVADAVGRLWDIAGGLRFWRSSAAHVFVLPPGEDARGVLYARFAPAGGPAGRCLEQGGNLHARLGAAGASVAGLVPSRSGRAVERISTPLGEMAAYVLQRADGEELEADELDATAAAAWGTALADFHGAGGGAGPGEGPPSSDFYARLAGQQEDSDLAAAAQTLHAVSSAAAPGPSVLGHGDFELDNLRWARGKFTCFDLDNSRVMPAAADAASAVRDLLGPNPGAPKHPLLLAAFLDGYRDSSGITIAAEDLLLQRAAFAAQQLLEAPHVLDITSDDGEGWLGALTGALTKHYSQQRSIVLATAALLG